MPQRRFAAPNTSARIIIRSGHLSKSQEITSIASCRARPPWPLARGVAAAFDQVIWRVASVAAFVLEIEGDRLGADPG
jgi:hypothetical protein